MKAIVKNDEKKGFEYIEVDKPKLNENEVLIEVEAAAICGTDVHYYNWDKMAKEFGKKYNIKFPFVVGHECAGTIIEIGKKVFNRKVGQRVAIETHLACGNCYLCQNGMAHNCSNMKIYGTSCNGCFAQYTKVEADATFILPDEISFKEAALLEPAGVAMRAVEESNIVPGDTVVVNGCGPIGLMLIQILNQCFLARVIAIDKDDYRLEMAKRMGATTINILKENTVKKVLDLTEKRGGADVLIEASGSAEAYTKIFDMIRNEGKLITVGHPNSCVSIDIMKNINIKGITVKGIFGRRIWNTWWNITSLIGNKKINLLDIVSHQYEFKDYERAFKQLENGAGKILFVKEKDE